MSLSETKYQGHHHQPRPRWLGRAAHHRAHSTQRDKIVAVTGGGIPPMAKRIAEMTGGIAVDGFRQPPPESEMACVVVDCGGTARCGVYPRKRIPTVNLTPVGQSGPLAQFITEDIYVSGVKDANIAFADGSAAPVAAGHPPAPRAPAVAKKAEPMPETGGGGFINMIASIGRVMGRVVGIFFNAGRRTIDQVVRNVLPFMAFVTMLIGIILYTGIGDIIAKPMGPLANNIVGLLVISAHLRPAVPVADPRPGRCHRAGDRRGHHRSANPDRDHFAPAMSAAGPVRLQHAGRLRLHTGGAGARRSQAQNHRNRRAGGVAQPSADGAGLRGDRLAVLATVRDVSA